MIILWERLERIAIKRIGPWLVCGDLNKIFNANEKRGGLRRPDPFFLKQ